jgi:integrase
MRITDDLVRKTKRPASGQLLLWDDLVQGFGVRLTPTKTTFVVQWRESASRKPRESLRPPWPSLDVQTARDLARRRLSQVSAPSFDGVGAQPLRLAMRNWYERNITRQQWRPRYATKVDSIIRCYIEGIENPRVQLTATAKKAISELGAKSVGTVKKVDVLAVSDAIKRGTAEQFMAIISSFYGDADDRGVEIPNPARNRLKATGGRRKRTRTPTEAEFLTLWRAFESEGDPARAAFTVLSFTACRRREATQMRRGELDLNAATWTLPPERRKTGATDPEPFTIHLHPYVVDILRAQPVLESSPYVFWGRRDKRPFEFNYALMQRLAKLVDDWRLHDMRRFARSGMGKLGVSQAVAEMCLGHIAKSGLVGVYDQHDYAGEMRSAWQRWGDHLITLVRS